MMEVEINGATYEMVESQGCKGCAFKSGGKCSAPIRAPKCYPNVFTSMIFVKKEMASQGDDEWDAKYEIFERHYPLIKWVVVAGLLGLVWLVSL